MRCLHVIDALRPSPITAALAALLGTRLRAAGESDVHDVLAFSGGAVDEALRSRARRIFVAGAGIDVAAVVHARAYDVIHAVDATVGAPHRAADPRLVGDAPRLQRPRPGAGRADRPSGAPPTRASPPPPISPSSRRPTDGTDARAELGSRMVRLDLARSGLVPADGSALSLDALPPRASSVLREWLACLARAAAA